MTNEKRRVIGGDVAARTTNARAEVSGGDMPVTRKRPGSIVEDETVVGTEDGGVKTRQPDGKIGERATDKRENR